MSDQLTGMLEVRAQTDEAAEAGEKIIIGFLTEPDVGAIYRYVHFSSNQKHSSLGFANKSGLTVVPLGRTTAQNNCFVHLFHRSNRQLWLSVQQS